MAYANYDTNFPNLTSTMDARPLKIKTIGILGGMSDQATLQYYREINAQVNRRLGGWDIGETIISGVNFGNIEYFVRSAKWEEAGDYLAEKAIGLQAAGADFLICVSNTMHRVAPRFMKNISIPFLHIGDPTGAAVTAQGINRIGLLGTMPVMATPFLRNYYEEKFSLEVVVPTKEEQEDIDHIIFRELVRGQVVQKSKDRYLGVCDSLASRGAQGIILGCTEIFLLLNQSDSPGLPFFDTTALHIAETVRFATEDASSPGGIF